MEPLPGDFDTLQYFETILPLVEAFDLLGFYQELEIRLKSRELVIFCALHEK